MTTHISARLAWHDNGWNGRICKDPAANIHCTGPYSFPGRKIATYKDIEWEKENADQACASCDRILPCSFSINAFGPAPIKASDIYFDKKMRQMAEKPWHMPANSVCTWPFDETTETETYIRGRGKRIHTKRGAETFFKDLEVSKSLIFYYVNFSNPLNIEEEHDYVVVGISRIKDIGPQLLRDSFSEPSQGSNQAQPKPEPVWARVIQSSYPEEGFCIPYQNYLENESVLEKIKIIPDDPINFKYGARHLSDDDAITLIERFLEIAKVLDDEGDETENWPVRIRWLTSLIGELWKNRGLFPCMLKVLDHIDFPQAMQFFKNSVILDPKSEIHVKDLLYSFLKGDIQDVAGLQLEEREKIHVQKCWNSFSDLQKEMLEDLLPRIDISKDQIENILAEDNFEYGIESTYKAIIFNSYALCEEYAGSDPADKIPFDKIDNGMLPAPDLGGRSYSDMHPGDIRRLRALIVEFFKKHPQFTCVPFESVLFWINYKVSFLSPWKHHSFTKNDIIQNDKILSPVITSREFDGSLFLYLGKNHDNERFIERIVKSLLERPAITYGDTYTLEQTKGLLTDKENPIYIANPEDYNRIITNQAMSCNTIIKQPVAIISGGAGTGKTTIIKTILQLIERTEDAGGGVLLLAPTGKASERLRDATGRDASTVHLFLAKNKWMRKNFAFKPEGGNVTSISTVIIDEASMLELTVVATLLKAIDLDSLKRLIFVGDVSQLPPIGTGKVFADMHDFFAEHHKDNLVELQDNVRQRLNTILKQGTGILRLAEGFKRTALEPAMNARIKEAKEEMIPLLARGGKVDEDLRVVYWEGKDDLKRKLLENIAQDLEKDFHSPGLSLAPSASLAKIWSSLLESRQYENVDLTHFQVLSPYRGHFFGVETLNTWLQGAFNPSSDIAFEINGIKRNDKIIQCKNRLASNPVSASYKVDGSYAWEQLQIMNGELGLATYINFQSDPKTVEVFFRRFPDHKVIFKRGEVFENLDLAYAISVHKSQGSEFARVFFVVPRSRPRMLTTELMYTAITRAKGHCTLLVEKDASCLMDLAKPENSVLNQISTSLFSFKPIAFDRFPGDWYPEAKKHATKAGTMVRSKSEVVIANLLLERGIHFQYEQPLPIMDDSTVLPDFTITWHEQTWYWEHLGKMDDEGYRNRWTFKENWYTAHGYASRLIVTDEKDGLDSKAIAEIIDKHFPEQD